jgi:hypothetical protein
MVAGDRDADLANAGNSGRMRAGFGDTIATSYDVGACGRWDRITLLIPSINRMTGSTRAKVVTMVESFTSPLPPQLAPARDVDIPA